MCVFEKLFTFPIEIVRGFFSSFFPQDSGKPQSDASNSNLPFVYNDNIDLPLYDWIEFLVMLVNSLNYLFCPVLGLEMQAMVMG